MDTLSYKTVSASKETAKKGWVIIDAEDQILGRLASATAMILRGKNKPIFTPHADCGDNVVIINAEKIRLTGNKMDDKEYISHSGYPGGQRRINPRKLMVKKPTAVVENAVRGMLPKNRLGRELFRNMFVYAGPEHKQEAQKPREVKLNEIK
ncbi:MAG: 50S ribosomal protein L13 [Bacteroidales bacterium]|nr:50S ribosomal protein L13 [Bacteroidales bacterium]